jgi:Na+/H+ antiporter NhaD/arsenite permease-like protein
MLTAVVATFVIGYVLIVLEHPLKLDKTIPALLAGVGCWTLIAMGDMAVVGGDHEIEEMKDVLLHHLGEIAQILFFLIGAMVIVELVDLHRGFSVITDRIRTTNKKKLLWMISWMAFFLSSVLDNLTTTIVFVSLLRRLIPNREERIWYVSFVVIAANAGGAWTPIGDVTTTMLWIKEKVTTIGLVEHLAVPSLACLLVPLVIAGFLPKLRGNLSSPEHGSELKPVHEKLLSSKIMLFAGVGGLIFVPVFKALTGLPPYMGMMLSLSIVWLISEFVHPEEDFGEERKYKYSARNALSRIELSSILFFLGILLAVSSLDSVVALVRDGEAVGFLTSIAEGLQHAIPNLDIVVMILGFLSSIVDNVPLVAAVMGMFPMEEFPIDSKLWQFIAYAAGTGGSIFIIGSAAGVAAMGMERIDFIWYFKRMSLLAVAGYLAGAFLYLLTFPLIHH